jgi:uncharacterized membrane-anchored protein
MHFTKHKGASPIIYWTHYIKTCLVGLSFENADELLKIVRGVLSGIKRVSLRAVFVEWMERLRTCIVTHRGSVE